MTKNKNVLYPLLAISLLQLGMMGLAVVLSDIEQMFPQYSKGTIQLVATLPDLSIVIAVLISGRLLRQVSKKILLQFSCMLFLFIGVGGFLFHEELSMILLWSLLLGVAIGTMISAVIAKLHQDYQGQARAVVLGYQNAAISLGGILITLLCAILAAYGWYYMYLLYIWGGVCCLMMRKLNKEEVTPSLQTKQEGNPHYWKWTLLYSLLIAIFFCVYNAVSTNCAMLLYDIGYEKQFYASCGVAILLSGSMVSGLCYGKIISRYKHGILLGIGMLILGITMILLSHSFYVMLAGLFVAGSSLSIVMTSAMQALLARTQSDMSVSIMLACSDFGGFLSFIFIELNTKLYIHHSIKGVYLILLLTALGLFGGILFIKSKKHIQI